MHVTTKNGRITISFVGATGDGKIEECKHSMTVEEARELERSLREACVIATHQNLMHQENKPV